MSEVATEDHKAVASLARDFMATYKDSEDLINIGAYVKGSSKKIDSAIQYNDSIESYLIQGMHESTEFSQSLNMLKNMFR